MFNYYLQVLTFGKPAGLDRPIPTFQLGSDISCLPVENKINILEAATLVDFRTYILSYNNYNFMYSYNMQHMILYNGSHKNILHGNKLLHWSSFYHNPTRTPQMQPLFSSGQLPDSCLQQYKALVIHITL